MRIPEDFCGNCACFEGGGTPWFRNNGLSDLKSRGFSSLKGIAQDRILNRRVVYVGWEDAGVLKLSKLWEAKRDSSIYRGLGML